MSLTEETCKPCRTGEGKLTAEQAITLLGELNEWVFYPERIDRRCEFHSLARALAFVNKVGALAEAQKRHPDIHFGWGYVELVISTHSAGGLTRNDFILAARIDALT